MSKAALFLFNKTPAMPKPWADAGYLCYCVDIQHPKGERREGNIVWVGADVHRYVPPMREPRRLDPTDGSRMHLLPPSDERANLRSATPAGFARAVFEANCQRVEVAA